MHRPAPIAVVAAMAMAALVVWSGAEAPSSAREVTAAQARSVDDDVRLNEVQVVGSHNSYKRMLSEPEQTLLRSFIGDAADQMAYEHEPLGVQFQSQKVRQIELDVFMDAAGGRYSEPLLRQFAGVGPYEPAMSAPGIKALHVQDVDYGTTCLTLVACLQDVKAWSDANPSHLPLAILVELKDSPLEFGDFGFVVPEPWTEAAMATLDAEIRSVFSPSELITPDDVRGGRPTLEEAVLDDGWPTLGESRGKVLFTMDNGGVYRTRYRTGAPNLEGRVLFTNSTPGQPDAAFVKMNNAFQEAEISALVAQGYLVRTRADGDTVEARTNDTTRRDAALRSGAQWVSTDYPVAGLAYGFTSDYVVEIPGGTVARCNPVNAPPTCVDAELDTIFTPVAPPARPTEPPPPAPGPSDPTPPPGGGPGTGAGSGDAPAAPAAAAVPGRPTYTG